MHERSLRPAAAERPGVHASALQGRADHGEIRRPGPAYREHSRAAGPSRSLQASVFFRDAPSEPALRPSGGPSAAPEGRVRLQRRLNPFVNLVHLALAGLHDAPAPAPLPRP